MNLTKSDKIQTLILTKNEEPNIVRVLDKLTWAEKVVILDSFSTDATIDIVKRYSNVEVHYRAFDTFAAQCNFGISLIESEWILSMDADYVLTDGIIKEIISVVSTDANPSQVNAYFAEFEFLVFGKKLRNNNTTPRAVLFRRNKGNYFDDGHAHRLNIEGQTDHFKHKILHDDRKSFSRWLSNQDGYSIKESEKLMDIGNADNNKLLNKIRRTKILAPMFVFFYCLFFRGLIFDGWAGWYYTLQRTLVEILFSLRLIEKQNFGNIKDNESNF